MEITELTEVESLELKLQNSTETVWRRGMFGTHSSRNLLIMPKIMKGAERNSTSDSSKLNSEIAGSPAL
ncbi:hypothetical protein M408DRAFT_333266 [Serendipita vermifera MAFF 305830]|uniref:Uncharacterized protein n=1 Tax=Serendipita vermifera MAFF 305830 TaxID=933852 RepID=A0A0C3AR86_SERVB|nr:hypothetical protein M408DRAFT_333266 [Serendipita vermifera MAFF 305830]